MTEEMPQPETPQTRRANSRYLWLVLVIPCLLYVLPLVLLRTPGFERWGGSLFGPALDFGFHASGQNADIVIFGDSSAMYGISPIQMSAALGAKVINLPNSGGSLPITGELALKRYLATNRPPRLLIFYLSPWDLDFAGNKNPFLFEGEEMLARNGTLGEIAAYARKHLAAALAFPLQVYVTCPRAALPALVHRENRAAAIKATMGHVDTVPSHPHLTASCVYRKEVLDADGVASAQALMARYRTPTTKALVYISPLPQCVNVGLLLDRSYAAVAAETPKVMDAALYMDDTQYVHLDPKAIPAATRNLVDAVRPLLGDGSAESAR